MNNTRDVSDFPRQLDFVKGEEVLCLFAHDTQRGRRGQQVRTDSWTLTNYQGEPINHRDGKSIRVGRLFIVSRDRLKRIVERGGVAFNEMVNTVEKTHAQVSGDSEEEIQNRQALVAAICPFHRKQVLGTDIFVPRGRKFFTYDTETVLRNLPIVEEKIAAGRQRRDMVSAQTVAIQGFHESKYAASQSVQYGSVRLQGPSGVKVAEMFPAEDGGLETVAKMSPADLAEKAEIPGTHAEAIVHIVQRGSQRSSTSATISDHMSEKVVEVETPKGRGGKKRKTKVMKEKTTGRPQERKRGGARNTMKDALLPEED